MNSKVGPKDSCMVTVNYGSDVTIKFSELGVAVAYLIIFFLFPGTTFILQ